MTTSVVSIVYVNDAPAAARFYGDLLDMRPSFETPGYITFDLGPGADLALWSDQFEDLSADVPRTSEVCLAIDGGLDEVNAIFKQWQSEGVTILPRGSPLRPRVHQRGRPVSHDRRVEYPLQLPSAA
ncbi:VOC family protein [Streptomyces sp. NPDC093591]|uniref:VOC family protein n=1 Tax=Streptomyces sp. NPDC093591 TaxID=3366044 RepID=UPI0038070835